MLRESCAQVGVARSRRRRDGTAAIAQGRGLRLLVPHAEPGEEREGAQPPWPLAGVPRLDAEERGTPLILDGAPRPG
ncbi:hypothetical protein NDU88_006447 [Pleurodeles waltl]|uniref:Uncharacterized protein n=1 Tax=Pleurodeles waltl TaxID=8319 RepID=A0AAV7TZJ1_PLEWA|nr:hypothetical protein NDU88_006447 [Pleurodeles waltl]